MIVEALAGERNALSMAGVRIHDYTHAHWRKDVDILVGGAGKALAYVTLPKSTSAAQVAEMIAYIRAVAAKKKVKREIPVHVLVETHGALHDAWEIAKLDGVQVLDFGLMDFVSGHHGAVASSNMRSPGQFEHPLIVRAKAEIVACALAHGVVPAHNVSLDLKNTYSVFRDAWRARNEFGFLRMWSIHPLQIQPIVDAMKPDLREVVDAAGILLAAQRASAGDRSSTRASSRPPPTAISGSCCRKPASPACTCRRGCQAFSKGYWNHRGHRNTEGQLPESGQKRNVAKLRKVCVPLCSSVILWFNRLHLLHHSTTK
jgi:citrate lyase subunit beta/citryl-CoA lyase